MTEKQKALPAPKEKTCFVVMPIADMPGYEPGHFKRVYEDLIKPACNKAGFKADRADDVKNTTMIHTTILTRLLEADMVVCDLSGKNPNVMFELGIRQAFDKPVVLIQEEGTTPIFDIGPLKYINYNKTLRYDNVLKSHDEISGAIKETYDKKDSPDSVNSIIKLLSITKAVELKPTGDASHDMLLMILSKLNSMDNKQKYNEEFTEYENINNKFKLTKRDIKHIEDMFNETKYIFESDMKDSDKLSLLEACYDSISHFFDDDYDISLTTRAKLNSIRDNYVKSI